MIVMAIRLYQALPAFMKAACPRDGLSCSDLALAAVRAGGGVRAVREVIGTCTACGERHRPVPGPYRPGRRRDTPVI